MKNWLEKIGKFFYPEQEWSKRRKIIMYAIVVLLLVSLVFSWTVFRAEKVVEKKGPGKVPVEVPAPSPAPTVREIIPQNVLDRLSALEAENARLRQQTDNQKVSTPTPAVIVWPVANKTITGYDARQLLSKTFINRLQTGAHFNQADLYTLEQFKEIRSKMESLASRYKSLPRPSLIDKVIGTFQEPGIENLPIGSAYPTSGSNDIYLIVILQVDGNPKVFGFDPLEKDKIWEIIVDPKVEFATLR